MTETTSAPAAPAPRRGLPARLAAGAGRTLKALGWFLLGNVVLLVTLGVLYLNGRPDLSVWHTAELEEEFRAGRADTFPAYLTIEEKLFRELDEKVVARVPASQQSRINRFTRDSLSSPSRWPRNWNRSWELPAAHPNATVLLLHGMSDSPYSLRAIGERLNAGGAHVVALRLPGHGTIPGALVDVTWQDFAAAVELAARHAHDKGNGAPFYIVGYSTGGALAIHYALRTLDDPALPKADGIVLVSPAMGVTPAAALAVWQARLGHLLGLKKLEWEGLGPEYDPFKYNSFAVNAADLVYRLAIDIQEKFDAAGPETLKGMPPVLAFQSAVDATVSTPAVITNLFDKLPAGGGELVIFDINRHSLVEHILANDPKATLEKLLGGGTPRFGLTVVTNEGPTSPAVVARMRKAGQPVASVVPLGLEWPRDVHSLSHVSLPMRYDDPLYGGDPSIASPGVRIGTSAARGERGVLQITPGEMLRLRWNPFYPWMEGRIVEFMQLPTPAPAAAP